MSNALNTARHRLVPWWLVLIEGILLIFIGGFLLTNPASTFVTIIWALGIYWLVSGIFNIVKIFIDSSLWGWKLLAGIVGILAGWFLIQNPFSGSVAVAATTVILLGLFGIFIGIVNIFEAFRGGGWGTGILGVVSIILGILLLTNRFLFTFSLPWTLGILAIFGGGIAIFNAFRLRGVERRLDDAADAMAMKGASMSDAAASRSAAAGAATVGAAAAAAKAMDDDTSDDTVDAMAMAAVEDMDMADEDMDMPDVDMSMADEDMVMADEDMSMADVDMDMVGDDMDADHAVVRAALVASVRSLDAADAEKLRMAGIEHAPELLERGASRQGRSALAKELGVDESTVLKWINDLDLARIKGIGVKYADLLETAGVDTVVELAQRNAENLFKKIIEVNAETGLVEALPSQAEVADWVAQAKALPRLITY